jgi:hypothetical protein
MNTVGMGCPDRDCNSVGGGPSAPKPAPAPSHSPPPPHLGDGNHLHCPDGSCNPNFNLAPGLKHVPPRTGGNYHQCPDRSCKGIPLVPHAPPPPPQTPPASGMHGSVCIGLSVGLFYGAEDQGCIGFDSTGVAFYDKASKGFGGDDTFGASMNATVEVGSGSAASQGLGKSTSVVAEGTYANGLGAHGSVEIEGSDDGNVDWSVNAGPAVGEEVGGGVQASRQETGNNTGYVLTWKGISDFFTKGGDAPPGPSCWAVCGAVNIRGR